MIIAVVDGQGGGIGKALVAGIKAELPNVRVIALGTNSTATGQMLRAGADDGATGENAIIHNMQHVDIVAVTLLTKATKTVKILANLRSGKVHSLG